MVIRPEQLTVLADRGYRRFLDELACRWVPRIRRDRRSLAPETVRQLVFDTVHRAEMLGFDRAADIERFVELTQRYGERLDLSAEAGDLLADDHLPPDERLDEVERLLDHPH